MAVRDTDDIIGQEKLRKIAEKKEQDRKALDSIAMLYQSKIEEQNKRNLERAEEQARKMRSASEYEEENPVPAPVKEESEKDLIPLKEEDFEKIQEEVLTPLTKEDIQELQKEKTK